MILPFDPNHNIEVQSRGRSLLSSLYIHTQLKCVLQTQTTQTCTFNNGNKNHYNPLETISKSDPYQLQNLIQSFTTIIVCALSVPFIFITSVSLEAIMSCRIIKAKIAPLQKFYSSINPVSMLWANRNQKSC